ncbi:protein lifeguard 2 [Tachysurus fulvidraco]|uniref:protein lifeguard 2 n=1 Tax=Tachysurus fulvidraco TaxID=1234273 RepID=UPI001FEE4B0F|nr:protein lifeguard 2 [Tachysurus fulvidraco]
MKTDTMTQGKLSVVNKSNEGSLQAPQPPSYQEATAGESPSYSDTYLNEEEMFTQFCWDDVNVRRIFIRKVYAILLLQLSVTLAIVSLFTFCEPIKDYIHSNPGWYWASYVVFLVTYLTLSCCVQPRRRFPWNLILLTVFTLSLSYMTGMLSSYYNTKSVMICLGITVLVCFTVSVFSFQTKIDVTSCQGVLCVICTSFFIFGLVLALIIPFAHVPWMQVVFAALGAILFSMFLAFDTQLLMGKKRHNISPEEYIFATLNIYLDVVYIFSFILQLFGMHKD